MISEKGQVRAEFFGKQRCTRDQQKYCKRVLTQNVRFLKYFLRLDIQNANSLTIRNSDRYFCVYFMGEHCEHKTSIDLKITVSVIKYSSQLRPFFVEEMISAIILNICKIQSDGIDTLSIRCLKRKLRISLVIMQVKAPELREYRQYFLPGILFSFLKISLANLTITEVRCYLTSKQTKWFDL